MYSNSYARARLPTEYNSGAAGSVSGHNTYALEKPEDDFSAGTGGDGWLFRPPENGHVITRGEVVSRIVPYYEMFLTNVFLLGWNVLRDASESVKVDYSVTLFQACSDRYDIPGFDYCAASRLVWGLAGGAVIYFAVTFLIALLLLVELRRKGYHSTFTAMWHSPIFLLCFFFPVEKRVDILSIPNKYVELSLWTRAHFHKIALAIYCAVCLGLVIMSLVRGTAETFVIQGQQLDEGLHKYYNPYLVPYYVAIYTFTRTLVTMVLEIFQDKNNRNKPERIGRYYKNIKID